MTDMELLLERYELSVGRIREIADRQESADKYKEYFKRTAEFVMLAVQAYEKAGEGFCARQIKI